MIENNNGLIDFVQIRPEYVHIDLIPDSAPELNTLSKETKLNPDGTVYNVYTYYSKNISDGKNVPILQYVENLQLIKEIRQSGVWKFPTEEDLRKIIFPGETLDRSYCPKFYSDSIEISYAQIEPTWDLSNCRLSSNADLDNLYTSCWMYVGRNLTESQTLPFNENLWLLKDPNTGNMIRFDVTEHKVYILPKTNMEGNVKIDSTIVTHETINTVLNAIGDLDCGEWW